MIIVLLSLLIIAAAGYLIIKGYQTQAVLFAAGILLLVGAVITGNTHFLPKGVKSTGFLWFDIFELIKSIFAGRVGKIGLIIMAAAGFARYMGQIGAADVLVRMAVKPLGKIKNPYITLALAYVVGQILNIFIPSAAGLAMLLLIAMYPLLIRIGATPASAAAVIGTTACLDLGPASGLANVGAKTAGMDVMIYFVKFQIPAAVATIVVIAVLHFIVQRYFDQKDEKNNNHKEVPVAQKELKNLPAVYALLPILPLAMLFVFSKLVVKSIKLNVVTAMFISLFVAMVFEFVRTRNFRSVLADIKYFFDGMGTTFSKIITLIFAAETFAAGLKAIGFIGILIDSSKSFGLAPFAMILVLVTIIGVTAFLSGSGVASYLSFASLAPDIAAGLSIKTVVMVLPMQLAAGIFRSFSPVAGVIIAVAGSADVSPFEIAKRTVIPMVGGLIVMILSSWIFVA